MVSTLLSSLKFSPAHIYPPPSVVLFLYRGMREGLTPFTDGISALQKHDYDQQTFLLFIFRLKSDRGGPFLQDVGWILANLAFSSRNSPVINITTLR